jgi:uncharacterized tellurite resistance protein B-like protein
MTPVENLHYAIGELAIAVALADGEIQKEERDQFHKLVETELRNKYYAFDISDIIFKVMDKQQVSSTSDAYNSALKEIKMNSHYLSPELKATFIKVMEKVANAYKPVTINEMLLIEKFKEDIAPIHGDPVYYSK